MLYIQVLYKQGIVKKRYCTNELCINGFLQTSSCTDKFLYIYEGAPIIQSIVHEEVCEVTSSELSQKFINFFWVNYFLV